MISFANDWSCLIQGCWKRFGHICRKLVELKIRNLLHRKADWSSKYVKIHVVKKIYVDFGYSNASYQFWVRRRDGHIAREDVSRRLRARTAKFLVGHQLPSNWNSESSGFGRRGEQKGGNGVQVLTAASVHGNFCWLDGNLWSSSIKRKLKCFNSVFGHSAAHPARPQRIDASHVVTHWTTELGTESDSSSTSLILITENLSFYWYLTKSQLDFTNF